MHTVAMGQSVVRRIVSPAGERRGSGAAFRVVETVSPTCPTPVAAARPEQDVVVLDPLQISGRRRRSVPPAASSPAPGRADRLPGVPTGEKSIHTRVDDHQPVRPPRGVEVDVEVDGAAVGEQALRLPAADQLGQRELDGRLLGPRAGELLRPARMRRRSMLSAPHHRHIISAISVWPSLRGWRGVAGEVRKVSSGTSVPVGSARGRRQLGYSSSVPGRLAGAGRRPRRPA